MSIGKPILAGTVMGLLLMASGEEPLSNLMFIAAGTGILMSIEIERPGYLHSIPSILILSSTAILGSAILFKGPLPGLSVSVGLTSSLLMDYMNDSLYIWKKEGKWLSAVPDERVRRYGEPVIAVISTILLVLLIAIE